MLKLLSHQVLQLLKVEELIEIGRSTFILNLHVLFLKAFELVRLEKLRKVFCVQFDLSFESSYPIANLLRFCKPEGVNHLDLLLRLLDLKLQT